MIGFLFLAVFWHLSTDKAKAAVPGKATTGKAAKGKTVPGTTTNTGVGIGATLKLLLGFRAVWALFLSHVAVSVFHFYVCTLVVWYKYTKQGPVASI